MIAPALLPFHSGGYPSEAFRYAKNNPLAYESRYGYEAGASTACRQSAIDSAASANQAAEASGGDAISGYYKVGGSRARE